MTRPSSYRMFMVSSPKLRNEFSILLSHSGRLNSRMDPRGMSAKQRKPDGNGR
jgi:hypothetical protein